MAEYLSPDPSGVGLSSADIPNASGSNAGLMSTIDYGNLVDTQTIGTFTASEDVVEGRMAHIWDDAGTPKVRHADSALGLEAHGIVGGTVTSGNDIIVVVNPLAVDPDTPAGTRYWLSTAGTTVTSPPTTGMVQQVGVVDDRDRMRFQPQRHNSLGATGYAIANDYMDTSGADITADFQAFCTAQWAAGREVWLSKGDYRISQLRIPSGGALRLMDGARIIRVNNGLYNRTNALIRNATLTAGNSDISVEGGTFTTDNDIGNIFGFQSVTGLRLGEFLIGDCVDDWATNIALCVKVNVHDFEIKGGAEHQEDGLHFLGGARINVVNGHIESGDDCIALTVASELIGLGESDLSDVNVSNITGTSAQAAVIKIVKDATSASAAQIIRRINLTNIKGKSLGTLGYGILVRDETAGARQVYDVRMANIFLDHTAVANRAVGVLNAQEVSMTNLAAEAQSSAFYVSSSAQNVRLVNCRGKTTGANNHVMLVDGSSTQVEVVGSRLEATASDSRALTVSSASRVQVNGGRLTAGSASVGLRLIDASNCGMTGATVSALTGVSESGTANKNRIVGNDLSQCTTPTTIVGANTVSASNVT